MKPKREPLKKTCKKKPVPEASTQKAETFLDRKKSVGDDPIPTPVRASPDITKHHRRREEDRASKAGKNFKSEMMLWAPAARR